MSKTPKFARLRRTLRKASAAARRFPAWVDGDSGAIGLPYIAEPRLRDSLLRIMAAGKKLPLRITPDAPRAS